MDRNKKKAGLYDAKTLPFLTVTIHRVILQCRVSTLIVPAFVDLCAHAACRPFNRLVVVDVEKL